MAFPNQTSRFMASQFGSPVSVVPSPGTTTENSPTMDFNFNKSQVFNATTPPLAQHFGSPGDTSRYSPHQHAAAVHGITNAYGSIQRTNFVAPIPPTSLAQQIQAIYHLLKRGTNPNDIVKYVETFKKMLHSGNFNDLAIIAVRPTEELAELVLHVGK